MIAAVNHSLRERFARQNPAYRLIRQISDCLNPPVCSNDTFVRLLDLLKYKLASVVGKAAAIAALQNDFVAIPLTHPALMAYEARFATRSGKIIGQ